MTVSNVNVSAATISTYIYVATGGETSKSGPDSNGATLSYTPGKEQVYLNGALLARGTDYTATDGSSITSLTALAASDILEVIAFSPFNVANAVQASNFAAKGDIVAGTAAGTFTNVTVGTNNYEILADSTQSAGIKWAPSATSVLTTTGDLLYASAANTLARLAVGTSSQVLVGGTNPTWSSTITSPTLSGATLTGTLTANSSAGTNGQYLQSTATGVQWASINAAPWTSSAISTNTNLATRYQYFCTTSSALTLTLPSTPSQGDEIRIFDASGGAATNNITVAPAGSTGYNYIHGSNQNFVINVNYGSATLIFTGTTYGWKVA